MEWHKVWPIKKMPDITSLPKGRHYSKKNVHNISRSSDEEKTPKKAKVTKNKGGVSNIAEYFERRDTIKAKKANSK